MDLRAIIHIMLSHQLRREITFPAYLFEQERWGRLEIVEHPDGAVTVRLVGL